MVSGSWRAQQVVKGLCRALLVVHEWVAEGSSGGGGVVLGSAGCE